MPSTPIASADDICGAARAATWLASAYLDFRGEDAIAVGWLQRARQLLTDVLRSPPTTATSSCRDRPSAPDGRLTRRDRELWLETRCVSGARSACPTSRPSAWRTWGHAALDQGRVQEGLRLLDQAIRHSCHGRLPAGPLTRLDAVLHHLRLRRSGRLRARGPMGRDHVQDRRALAGAAHERPCAAAPTARCSPLGATGLPPTASSWPLSPTSSPPARLVKRRAGQARRVAGPPGPRRGGQRAVRAGRAPTRAPCSASGPWPGRKAIPTPPPMPPSAYSAAFPTSSLLDRFPALELLALASKAGLGRHDEARGLRALRCANLPPCSAPPTCGPAPA